jgi:hypothetical protein
MSRTGFGWLQVLLLLGLAGLTGGCASTAMRPWDRDLLAEKKMSFSPSPRHTAVDQHVYSSREASTGGMDVGGGGCGCN